MKRVSKMIKYWGIPIACGLLVIFIFQFVLMIGYVPSASMEPTIQQGSYIVGLRIHGEPKRGDIVMFKMNDRILVKRIAGVPWDTVRARLAGVQGTEEIIITVPEGYFYMLGDNKADSYDSRYWADPFIREEDILARLFIR